MIWRRKTADQNSEFSTFKHLLLICSGVEGDAELLKTMSDLAGQWAASVTVLSVVEPPSEIERIARATGETVAEITKRILAERQETVTASAAEFFTGANVDVLLGKPFIEIIRYAITNDVDLVVKNAEELPGLGRYLFASTDQHLLRKNPCPVWLRRSVAPASAREHIGGIRRRCCKCRRTRNTCQSEPLHHGNGGAYRSGRSGHSSYVACLGRTG